MELVSQEPLDTDMRRNIATEMLKSQAFDNFLATKFVTVKRYGGEGAESMMAFFCQFLNSVVQGKKLWLIVILEKEWKFYHLLIFRMSLRANAGTPI